MNLNEIKEAVLNGHTVHWGNEAYVVKVDAQDSWFIACEGNNSVVGLTWADGVTLNGKEEEFFLGSNN